VGIISNQGVPANYKTISQMLGYVDNDLCVLGDTILWKKPKEDHGTSLPKSEHYP